MITTALKSYFYVIVALASIVGSVIAAPYISNFVGTASSDPPRLTQTALAQSLPHTVDHHVEIKERTGDPVRVEEWMNDADRNCEMSCTFAEFSPGRHGKAGLAYVSDSPMDLSGAKRVHFFLMGDKGGEMVKVYIAGKDPASGQGQGPGNGQGQGPDSLFREKFARSTGVITLTNDWQRYEISLAGVDLTDITAPFAIELFRGRNTAMQAVYFKFIVYENQAVDQRFALAANGTDNATATTAEDNATATTAEDNATATTAEDTSSEPEITNATSNTTAPTGDQSDENSAPVAMLAVDSLVANPGDRVILDGSLSNDPDGDEITYQWSQSGGPDAEMIGAETVTPTVTIPQLQRDDVITIDLVVSDGQTESNRASVAIDVQYVEEIEDAINQDLRPDDDISGQGWSDSACDSNGGVIVDCLIDSSDSTFVSSDTPDQTTDLLFSFEDPSSVGINSSNNIAYVTAQVSAKKTGPTGFTSLIVDDPSVNEHYSTPSISIISDSFEEYGFTWENNPLTGEPWTMDSLNALVAGFRYSAGQGSIQISEFKLIVTSLVVQEEQEPSPPPSSSPATDSETSSAEESEPVVVEEETEPAVEEENGDNNSDEEDNTTTTPAEEPTPDDNDVASDDDEGASIEEDNE